MNSLAIYVINLDRNGDRLQSISQQLRKFGISYQRIAAVDGSQMPVQSQPDYDSVRAERHMGRNLVGGEIGCYRSHLLAARQFLASDARYALILEDDARLRSNPLDILAQALPELDAADPQWLLINLGSAKLKIATPLASYEAGEHQCQLAAAHYFPITTHALVWSRHGAEAFVREHDRIFAPVDNYFRYWLTRSGHGYCLWPAPVSTIDAVSEIMGENGKARRSNDRKWYYELAKQYRLSQEKFIALRRKKSCRLAVRRNVSGTQAPARPS